MSNKSDNIYAKKQTHLVDFVFDKAVVNVFPDMIRRSVPGYENIITMIGLFTEQYAQQNSQCYDLGCSLGAATLAIRHHINKAGVSIIAVDNSESMIEQCQQNINADPCAVDVRLICDDIQNIDIQNASVVILNFTLQFLPPESREALLSNINKGMNKGGVLVLSEKITFDDPLQRNSNIKLHEAFKKANGYSELEISQKRSALENTLIPETVETHQQRLKDTGFTEVSTWFQCFNFVSMLAIK